MRSRLVWLVVLLAFIPAFGQTTDSPKVTVVVPRLIRFSGQSQQADKADKTVGITFTLYKSQNDKAPVWLETQNVKLDHDGKYSILLGVTQNEGLPLELFISGEAQWLGVRVEGQAEQPRILLVSVPYALKAAEAETLGGHTVNEFVTREKLETTVHEQLVKEGTSSSDPKKPAAKGNATTSGATNFTDTTTNQVVQVTQSGTGSGLIANATSGYAVQAKSVTGGGIYTTSGGNAALSAYNTSTTGTAYGVLGSTTSPSGVGFRGKAAATTGSATGVMGDSASSTGTGLYGTASATTGTGTGVYGRSYGDTGVAMKAYASSTTGSTMGVQSTVSSPDGISLVARNTATGKLISGQAGSTNKEVFSLDTGGKLLATSGTFSGSILPPGYILSGKQTATGPAIPSGVPDPSYFNTVPAAVFGMSAPTSGAGAAVLGKATGAGALGVVAMSDASNAPALLAWNYGNGNGDSIDAVSSNENGGAALYVKTIAVHGYAIQAIADQASATPLYVEAAGQPVFVVSGDGKLTFADGSEQIGAGLSPNTLTWIKTRCTLSNATTSSCASFCPNNGMAISGGGWPDGWQGFGLLMDGSWTANNGWVINWELADPMPTWTAYVYTEALCTPGDSGSGGSAPSKRVAPPKSFVRPAARPQQALKK